MTLSLADFFCGAGGSSTGAVMVPGVELVVAANHWDIAIDTHAANHPAAEHIQADISQYDPRLFPTADLAWLSPFERHGLITRHFGNVGGNPARHTTPAAEPVRVITTSGQQSVMTTELLPVDLDDVRFRMLEPREIKRAMDFPADYTLLGTRREQVRLSGNAVTPPCARDLVTVVAESLGVA